MDGGWHFWIDRGGTFTDVVALDPAGRLRVHKLLSECPDQYADAPSEAIRRLRAEHAAPITAVRMGTTLATNALLERKGARTALLITQGFADLLEIGYQNRPDLFAIRIEKPASLECLRIEVDERILADGTVEKPLDESLLRSALVSAREAGIEALAIVFLNSYANPVHELRAGVIAAAAGFDQVSLSHAVANEIKAVGRGDTTVVDAYLSPILRRYIGRLRSRLGPDVPLRFMQSNGGLADADRFSGKDAVLSGPAGGVVAYAEVCAAAGFHRVIGFDMGGTSTDVSRYDGRFERVYETTLAGIRLKAPMMAIETVAAGGGSILKFDEHRYLVGPESAGANPGPACYGRGGPATVTDANLVLGRIQAAWFPNCFGPDARQPLDLRAARARIAALADTIGAATGQTPTIEAVAAGFVRVANANMAKPVKELSVSRGYDVQEYALCCFGGAGAQHACAIADGLGIRTILLHPLAGVLSAYGMGLADLIHTDAAPVLEPLEAVAGNLDARFADLERRGFAVLEAEGFAAGAIVHERSLDLRYTGVDATLNISPPSKSLPDAPPDAIRAAFEAAHAARYGFTKPGHPIEVVALRVETRGVTEKPVLPPWPVVADGRPAGKATVHFDALDEEGTRTLQPRTIPVYRREQLGTGASVSGPALIIEATSTIVIDPGWSGQVDSQGMLVLAAADDRPRHEALGAACDPVMLEVFNGLFMSIAEQMGNMLERTSHSANIKERLDFSCAVFSPAGELVANAPHIPVHLGAMGESVKAVIAARGESMQPGDAYVTNDPYQGGSHLPDITVVTPVFSEAGERIFLVANRGHHADVGGITPGSMPPFSTSIEEEGVVIHNFLLVSRGHFREAELLEVLQGGPYPARNLPERLSDLHAQLAANAKGADLLRELCARYTTAVVQAYMGHVRANAAATMRDRIRELPDGTHRFEDALDDGARIACTLTIDGDRAVVDFEGTARQLPGNLNAPPAVVMAAVLYVFRTLVRKPIPLNSGCLDPIEVHIPEGCLLSPRHPAAVVGGNVETSQRVCDVLYGALGVAAASQGTMNNLTFGNDDFGYYETICGGTGAGPDFDGASAVHSHMTNTRITDPEVLERRYPVVLRAFHLRRGSGGAGKHRGGDGIVRVIEFRQPVRVSILSERRRLAPYGMAGGAAGAPGVNTHLAQGQELALPGHASFDARAGDAIRIETPGGGGWGAPHGAD
ncbi:MAG: hydantoinase B/oxoprolinase family protein [Candidatus Hydrogenedentes bacterium]|nr:hydantoinase B/oxoprolinase family protein [Candidatus Hydrogenedentota bacterium]